MPIYDENTTYNDLLEKLKSSNYTIENPYTRGLLEQGILNGTLSPLATAEGQQAEVEKRSAYLQQAVVEPLAAQRTEAFKGIQKQYEKAGKLSSSGTAASMYKESELYGAQIASELAKGTLGIYEQVGTEASAERERILKGSMSQSELGLGYTQLGVTTETERMIANIKASTELSAQEKQFQIATLQIGSAESIVALNATTQTNIANIQASTELSAQEKQMQIAQLNTASQERQTALQAQTTITTTGMTTGTQTQIAQLQAQTDTQIATINASTTMSGYEKQVEIAKIQAKTDADIAALQATTAITTTGMTTATQEKIATMNLSQTDKELVQRAYEFGITQIDATTGSPRWMQELKSMEATETQKLELARDRLKQEQNQFDTTSKEGMLQFQEQLQWAKDQFGMSDKTQRDLVATQMSHDIQVLNLNNDADYKKFSEQLAWAKTEYALTAEQQWNMFNTKLTEDKRQFDTTTTQGRKEFAQTIALTKKQIEADIKNKDDRLAFDKQVQSDYKELTTQQLNQDWQKFNLTQSQDMAQFWESLNWAKTEFAEDLEFKKTVEANAKQQFLDSMEQRKTEFNISTANGMTQFWENIRIADRNLEITRLSDLEKKGMFYAQMEADKTKFDLSRADSNAQFWENWKLAKQELNLKEEANDDVFRMWFGQMEENKRQFDLSRADSSGQFWENWKLAKQELNLKEEANDDVFRMWSGQMEENKRQFDLTNEVGQTQFWAQMSKAQQELDLNAQQIEQQYTMFKEQMTENKREFDLTRVDSNEQFWDNWELANRQLNLTEAQQQDAYDMWSQSFQEQIKEFDLTRTDNLKQVADAIEWNQKTYWHEDIKRTESLKATFEEQQRQFNVSTFNQWESANNVLQENARQYNLTREDMYDPENGLAIKTYELQAKQLEGTQMGQFIDYALTIIKDPAIFSAMKSLNPAALDNLVIKTFGALATEGGLVGLDMTQLLTDISQEALDEYKKAMETKVGGTISAPGTTTGWQSFTGKIKTITESGKKQTYYQTTAGTWEKVTDSNLVAEIQNRGVTSPTG